MNDEALMPELEPHPLCLMFPEMSADDYAGLLESIREDGPTHSIVMYEGKILDGRHRYKACVELGITPRIVEYRGQNGDPLRFVVAENLHRRHLSASQLAATAVEVKRRLNEKYAKRSAANLKVGDRMPVSRVGNFANSGNEPAACGNDPNDVPNSETEQHESNARIEAAKLTGAGDRYIGDADQIAKASPETFEEVKAGKLSIPQAKKKLGISFAKPKTPKPEPEPELERKPNAIVNGVPAYDDGVARMKAAGKIPEGVTPVVDQPDGWEDGAEATMEAVREEMVERAAKIDDLTDDEWLATLPLNDRLTGRALDLFRRDATHYRRLEPIRERLLSANGEAANAAYKGASHRKKDGYVQYRVSAVTRMGHPKDWVRCADEEHGGCAGTGLVPVYGGECPECFGRGYRAS